jgi:FixJ family two-component response regulator
MNEPRGIVFVVDDDSSVRKASARLFRSAGLQVETFETARAFLDYTRPDVPSCLVLDVRMPGLSGFDLQEQLTSHGIDLPIVFMTGHGDIPMTVQAMKAGAVDFLPKPVNDERLLATVETAIAEDANKREQSTQVTEFRGRLKLLTTRENEVMRLVITGILNKQIARKLGITEATVKVHRGRMMEKTGVNSVAELVRLSEKAGLSQDRRTFETD